MPFTTCPPATVVFADVYTGNVFPGSEAVQLGANDGFNFLNHGNEIIRIRLGGTATSVTLVYTKTVDSQPVVNRVINVSPNQIIHYGPFKQGYFNDASGYVTIYVNAATTTNAGLYLTPGTFLS